MSTSTLPAFPELLQKKLEGIATLTSAQLKALQNHYELLVRWNRVLNLTSVDSVEDAVERHYCESVFLACHLPPHALRIADIGSGAGFPGIPVAVLRPDCSVFLVESHQRKAVFLKEATRHLENVKVLAMRAEDVKERFDRVVARAVSYEDLGLILKAIAPAADLLTGGEVPPAKWCFTWNSVQMPWGRSRFLRSGVSRGTTS